jgi:hypothetical protein
MRSNPRLLQLFVGSRQPDCPGQRRAGLSVTVAVTATATVVSCGP